MQWTIRSCDRARAAELAHELGLSQVTASVLVRRGYADPEAATSFLDGADPRHDPALLGDMEEACTRIRSAIDAGTRICVHGDYDADGICAAACALAILREAGAQVDVHLPSRFHEGYGVRPETLARLAGEGYGLVLTVDCGITAAEAIEEAARLGLEMVVTDHHRPAEQLPKCPLVVTRPSEYPFRELAGTGVVFKLGEALLGPNSPVLRQQLDLVALATIADVVPLVGENRSLAIAGLRALARTQRPGLKALMRAAHVDAAAVDSGAVAYRLAPRINAAGRLGHPGTALRLLTTDDAREASDLAEELERLNRERQSIEDRIGREAAARIEEWADAKRRRRAYVLADEEWHEGVIGIVASRLVERYHRPVVLIAGGEREWKGSGRSIPAFDLHAGLSACAGSLERFGGHRAAAGLVIHPERIHEFQEALADHADSVLGDSDLRRTTAIDAVLPPGTPLTLALCEELGRLAPFGLGNPNITLLAPACEVSELAAVGDGKHLRFRVHTEAGGDGSAIAFGMGRELDRLRRPGRFDVVFRLEANRWNGSIAPQLVVQRIFDTPDRYRQLREWLRGEYRKDGSRDPVADEVFAELELESGARRSLLESERFRELLVDEPLPRAA